MTKEEFATYLRALRRRLRGDQAILHGRLSRPFRRCHFRPRRRHRRRAQACGSRRFSNWDVLDVVADDNAIAIHAILEMRFNKDAPPDFALGPFKAGNRIKTRFCGFYKLRGAKICEFRVFPFLGEHLRVALSPS